MIVSVLMENHLAEQLEERNDRWIPPSLRPRYAALREQATLIGRAREIMGDIRARLAARREAAAVAAPADKNAVAARD